MTNRINLTSSIIAESNNSIVNEVHETSNNNNINNNNQVSKINFEASTPKQYDAISHLTNSSPLVETPYLIEDNSVNNYSISNDMYPNKQTTHSETLPKRNSIKNIVNDDEYEALSYEPPIYVDQQPAGNLC